MNERPILMNGDMVRAIQAGRKTQTRRPIMKARDFANQWAGAVLPAASDTSARSIRLRGRRAQLAFAL